jgi:cytidine deaminase
VIGQAVWLPQQEFAHSGVRAKSWLLQQQAVYAGGGKVDLAFLEKAAREAKRTGKFPLGSPDAVSKGTLYTNDIANLLYGDVSRFVDPSVRPDVWVRSEWGPRAVAGAGSLGESGPMGILSSFGWGRYGHESMKGAGYKELEGMGYGAPRLWTRYMKGDESGFKVDRLNKIMHTEEALIDPSVAHMVQYESSDSAKILLGEGFGVHGEILSAMQGGGDLSKITTGATIGVDATTGRLIKLGEGESVAGIKLAGDDTAQVFLQRGFNLADRQGKAKIVGPGVKAVARVGKVSGAEMRLLGKGLTRDRGALIMQQISALGLNTAKQMSQGFIPNEEVLNLAQQMLENPYGHFQVGTLLKDKTEEAFVQLQKNMWGYGQTLGFTKRQLGETFGFMDPRIAAQIPGASEIVENAKSVIGLADFRMSQVLGENLGKRGSIDFAGIRVAAMKGSVGERYAAELATRIEGSADYPHAQRMFTSAVNEESVMQRARNINPNAGVQIDDITKLTPENLIGERGRYLSLGRKSEALGGADKFWVAGSKEVGFLSPFTTATGESMTSETERAIRGIQQAVIGGNTEDIEAAATIYRNHIAEKALSLGSVRGKVIGSKNLAATRLPGHADEFARMHPGELKEMLEDAATRATTAEQKALIAEQLGRVGRGEAIHAARWRFPMQGLESMAFTQVMPDMNVGRGEISLPRMVGEINGRMVDISQDVGQKLDRDGDQMVISAITDRDTTARLANRSLAEAEAERAKFLFSHYNLGAAAKANKEEMLGMTAEQMYVAGVRKNVVAKIATPQINTAMAELKLGIMNAAPDKYERLAPVLWHLEEASIGGKKGALAGDAYERIASAIGSGDAGAIESELTGVFGGAKEYSGTVKMPTGEYSFAQNWDPKMVAQDISEVRAATRSNAKFSLMAQKIATGKSVEMTTENLASLARQLEVGSGDVAQELMTASFEKGSGWARKGSDALRKAHITADKLTSVFGRHKTPILGGLAAAAGIMMLAPPSGGNLALPPPTMRPQFASQRAAQMGPEDLGPQGGLRVRPPAARTQIAPSTYDIQPPVSPRADIRMSPRDMDSSRLMRHSREMAYNSSVRMRVRDDRESLDPHRLADKIYDRL